MKILRLSCENINSLKGPIHNLEIGTGVLAKHGLFAITGPTGVGKSTLLDVICVALYGKTPRLERKTENLMSKLAAFCWAEVEFELKGAEYRCRWELHRSRKKVTGAIQSPKMFLAKIQGDGEGELIEDKFSKVPIMIQDLTGLDFQRFCRSMLLAQGEFDAFLKGNDNEKAELLEKMTGTEIYKDISMKVYEKAKFYENKWKDNLTWESQHLELKNSRSSIEIEKELNELNAMLQVVLKEREQCQKNIVLAEQKEKLELKLKTLTESMLQWEVESQAQQRKKWLLWKKAEPAFLRLNQLQDSQARLKDISEKLNKAKIKGEELSTQLLNVQKEKEMVQSKVEEVNKKYLSMEELLPVILKLREQIENLKKIASEAENQLFQVRRGELKLKEEMALHVNEKRSCDKLIAEIEEWEKSYGKFDELSLKLNELKIQCEGFLQVDVDLLNRSKLKTNLEQEIKKRSIVTEEQLKKNEILEGKKSKLDEELKSVENEKVENFSYIDEDNELETLYHKISKYEKLQEVGVSLKKYKANIENKNLRIEKGEIELEDKNKLLMKVERELQELKKGHYIGSFSEARETLDSDEVCPLCGSKDHAFHHLESVSVATPENILKKEKELDQIQRESITFIEKLRSEKEAVLTDSKDLEEESKKYSELLKELGVKIDVDSENIVASELESLLNEKKQLQERNQKKKELDRKLMKLYAERKTLGEQSESVQSDLNKFKSEEKDFVIKLDQIEGEIKKIKESQSEKSRSILEGSTWLKVELISIEDVLKKTNQFSNDLKLKKESFEQAIDKRQVLDLSIVRVEEQLKELVFKGEALKNDNISYKSELIKVINSLQEVYETPESFDADYEALKELKKMSESQLQLLINKGHELQFELKHGQSEILNLKKDLPELKAEVESKQKELVKSYTEQGFDSQASLESAVLHEDLLTELSDWNLDYEARGQVLSLKLDESRKELATFTEVDLQKLRDTYRDLNDKFENYSKQSGALVREREEDLKWQRQHADHLEKRNELEKTYKEWDLLRQLIGSADGNAFRKIAQKVTLKFLLKLANRHLGVILERYQLIEVSGSELNIALVDQYQAMSERPLETLSGGERFMVSLALALSLSDISRRGQSIESLFIDEGFGSLDAHALDRVLEALDKIRQMGRSIGVISHVEALKERISAQIKIEPLRNGMSRVSIVEAH